MITRLEVDADCGHMFVFGAPQEMQIVGTNVILDRQQRLTEEYVPRADLILFVMSADRPFSESEVRGMRVRYRKCVGKRGSSGGGGARMHKPRCKRQQRDGSLRYV
jgi:hypothetical protein